MAENFGQNQATRILVVEDHADTLSMMLKLLNKRGYTVEPASSARSARMVAAGGKFDLVISDLGLPDGSGVELMRELSATYGLKGIALTGNAHDEQIADALQSGFVRHLTKPIDFLKLETAIKEVLVG